MISKHTQGATAKQETVDRLRKSRHNIPLSRLAQDGDERYRPSAKLRTLVETNTVPAYRSLDRPLVPVLNQLIAKGVETRFSCADSQILIRGVGLDAVRLLAPLLGLLTEATIEWAVLNGTLVTGLLWRARDRTSNDLALLEGAEMIALLPERTGVNKIHPAGEFVAHAYARIYALLEGRRSPTLFLEQTPTGYSMHIGYSITKSPATKIYGASLAEVSEKFEATFPGTEEEIEIG